MYGSQSQHEESQFWTGRRRYFHFWTPRFPRETVVRALSKILTRRSRVCAFDLVRIAFVRPRPPQAPPRRNPRHEAVKGRRAGARDTPTSVGTSRPRSVSRPDRSRTTDTPSMMACARAGALAARAGEAPGCSGGPVARASRAGGYASRGAGGAPARARVAAGALAAAGPSTVAFAAVGRRGFGAAGARGGAAVSAVAVTGKATRSIDEMDMDPEHVTFASQDELDHRCASARTHLGFFSRACATVAARVGARASPRRAPTRRRARPRPRGRFSLFPSAFTTGHTPRQTRHRGLRPQRVRRADLTRARESADHVARVRSRATRAGTTRARRSARALTRAPPRAPSRPASAEIPPPGPTRRAREAPSAHLFCDAASARPPPPSTPQ